MCCYGRIKEFKFYSGLGFSGRTNWQTALARRQEERFQREMERRIETEGRRGGIKPQ